METERSSTEPKRKKTDTENSKKESNYWKRDLGNEKTDFIWRYPVGDRAGPDPGSTEGPNAGAGVRGQGPWAQYINRYNNTYIVVILYNTNRILYNR